MRGARRNRTVRVVLCGLTGFANPVLRALAALPGIQVVCVVTEREAGPFPYYPEEPLEALCHRLGVSCVPDLTVSDSAGTAFLASLQPDLILVATFRQIFKASVLSIPRIGTVNLHPSLLPRHRGPCPSQAALLDGSQMTGVTAHWMAQAVDTGNILVQRSLAVLPDDDDGRLRHRLAIAAGEMIPELIGLLECGAPPDGTPQDQASATSAPRLARESGFLEEAASIAELTARLKATSPLPGASYRIGDLRIPVRRWEAVAGGRKDGIYPASAGAFDVHLGGHGVRLYPLEKVNPVVPPTPSV